MWIASKRTVCRSQSGPNAPSRGVSVASTVNGVREVYEISGIEEEAETAGGASSESVAILLRSVLGLYIAIAAAAFYWFAPLSSHLSAVS